MKSLSPAFQDHLLSGATTLCWCWRLTRRDGLVLGFTDHDRDLSFDGAVFEAATGFTASEVREAVGLSVDNLEVTGALSSPSLDEATLAAGLLDDARIEIFRVNWQDTAQRLLVRSGSLGEISRSGKGFVAEVRGLAHYLQQPKGRLYQFTCDADLGDGRCRAHVDGPDHSATASVASVNGRVITTTELAAFPGGWFSRGLVTWTGGANAGRAIEVRRHEVAAGSTLIELWQPMSEPILVGDTFTVRSGCDKLLTTCRDKFANQVNFRGFPHMPGNDFLAAYPSLGDSANDGGSRWS
ncbi:MAG: DUF2163 domain-containing protein [Hyphomicrobiaceae bacterium]